MIEDINSILNTFFGVTLGFSFYQIFVGGKVIAGNKPSYRTLRFSLMVLSFIILILISIGLYVTFGNELGIIYNPLTKFYFSLMPLAYIGFFKGIFYDYFKNKSPKSFYKLSLMYLIGCVLLSAFIFFISAY